MEALTDEQLAAKLARPLDEETAWAERNRERDTKFRAANSRRQSRSKHRAVCAAAWFAINGLAASTNRGGK